MSLVTTIQDGETVTIKNRDDLSFTFRDELNRLVNWPRNNPGVFGDWEKGMGFFDSEITQLASADETEAYWAILSAILDMGGSRTGLEFGFSDRIARAAVLGLHTMRNGV